MDDRGRSAFVALVEARIAEWDKNITLLGHRMAKAKDDPVAAEKVAAMKSRLPVLADKAKTAAGVPESAWPDLKSEVDLIFEDLMWHQNFVMRRLGAS